MGTQWLSGRVLDLKSKFGNFETHRGHCVVSMSTTLNLCLVLVQPRKTEKRPDMSEKLLTVTQNKQNF